MKLSVPQKHGKLNPTPFPIRQYHSDTNLPKARWDHISQVGFFTVSHETSRCSIPIYRDTAYISYISQIILQYKDFLFLFHKLFNRCFTLWMLLNSAMCELFITFYVWISKARHCSHYPVKLKRTGKVHSDPDSLMLLPLFSGFHLKTTLNEHIRQIHVWDCSFAWVPSPYCG